MAISGTVQWEVETGGTDTNGGGFTTLTVNSDLAATSATGASPVVSSASYNFVSGDVGAMVFIKSGTNWIPGWYPIVSVAANAATLDAAIGHVAMYARQTILNPTTGCATTASPSSGSWSIDYCQKGSKNTTGSNISTTDAVTAGTTTITSITANFQPSLKGNVIYITGGTGSITANRYEVTAVGSTTSITVDRSTGLSVGTGATMNIGGAFLTVLGGTDAAWKTSGSAVADGCVYVQKGAYSGATITSASWVGPSQYQSRLIGYNVYRGDNPTAQSGNCPSYATTGAASNGWLNSFNGYSIWNFTFDGTGTTGAAVGVTNTGALESCVNVKVSNYSSTGFSLSNGMFLEAFQNGAGGISAAHASYSYSHKNTGVGFSSSNQVNIAFTNCVAANNTSTGILLGYQSGCHSCIAFGNGGDGISFSSLESDFAYNCISASNGGWGLNGGGGQTPYNRSLMVDYNAYHNNASGTVTGGVTLGAHDVVISGTASTTPFNQTEANNKSETSPDWTLNNTAGAGALLRATGLAGITPGVFSTASYSDFGPFQHQDSGGASTNPVGMLNFVRAPGAM